MWLIDISYWYLACELSNLLNLSLIKILFDVWYYKLLNIYINKLLLIAFKKMLKIYFMYKIYKSKDNFFIILMMYW